MINFTHFELNNGLKVYVHEDSSSLSTAFNLCYNVGSRDEDPNKTGFAHLFEHLMFGGSKNIPIFDEPLQKAGGSNNAFTSPDITNYYITVPNQNLETAFWLESDRMLSLSFNSKVLEVQKKVVIEEFKQRYLNQPYGDLWLKFRPLIYQKHPYSWPTIGKEISHIENATMDDVKDFFYKFYLPNNAVLVVAGNVSTLQVEKLCKKWFGDIAAGKVGKKPLPAEPVQQQERTLFYENNVPVPMLYKAYKTPPKNTPEQFALDLFADVMGKGQTSELYQKLVKQSEIFTGISADHIQQIDGGLLIIHGSPADGVTFEEANRAVEESLEEVFSSKALADKLEKSKVKAVSLDKFSETEVLNRAMKLAFAANEGDPELCNIGIQLLDQMDNSFVNLTAQKLISAEQCSTLYYSPKAKE